MRMILSSRRRLLMAAIDLAVLLLAYYAAFVLRVDHIRMGAYTGAFLSTAPLAVACGFVGMYFAGVYASLWRYVSVRDLMKILRGTALGTGLLVPAVVFTHGLQGYPRSVFLINALLVVLGVAGVRVGRRVQIEMLQPGSSVAGSPVLIVGAGDAADDLVRELRGNRRLGLAPIGLVDDDAHKQGMSLHGVTVVGRVADIPRLAAGMGVAEVLIAIASASGAEMRRIIALCQEAKVPYRTLPGVGDILDGKVQVSQLRKVNVEDLLRRQPVRLDREAISGYLRGKRVLVTGAGGSIGSEVCRQVAKFSPEEIILLDHSENGLFYVEEEFHRAFPHIPVRAVVADVAYRARIQTVMREVRPHVVFHAAAHKHVYLMERNFWEAFRNNVTGTRTVAEAAAGAGVGKFVMISTDKAVNPTSVMGLSKRIAELVVQEVAAKAAGGTEFVAVRFGNVMGSEGSVIPLWWRQIREGRFITVTHPEVVRYFMTIPEAVQLVLQAATMGRHGEVFLLDMGEPVKVVELAREVIRLAGLVPDEDVEIRFIGLRPGEKLYEELITAGEGVVPTAHEKIMVLRASDGGPSREIVERIYEVEVLVAQCAPREQVLEIARRIVPEYQKDHAGTEPPQAAGC